MLRAGNSRGSSTHVGRRGPGRAAVLRKWKWSVVRVGKGVSGRSRVRTECTPYHALMLKRRSEPQESRLGGRGPGRMGMQATLGTQGKKALQPLPAQSSPGWARKVKVSGKSHGSGVGEQVQVVAAVHL